MAEINTDKGGHQKGKPKKLSTRVDFTPMVDLGFLLITFFMLATTMIKPQTMEIVMPANEKDQPKEDKSKVNADKAITIIMGKKDKLFYYEGTKKPDGKDPVVITTNYSPTGLRKYLLKRNAIIVGEVKKLKSKYKDFDPEDSVFKNKVTKIKMSNNKGAPVVLIKGADNSNFKNFVDILDEMQICNISVYAIADITDYDLSLIKDLNK